MKRILCIALVIGLVAVFGCAQEKPEAAAQKIFEQQVAGHEGLQLDASGLAYNLVEQGEDKALVEVSGLMPVKASIPLVKKQGKWVLDVPSEAAAAPAASH